MKKLSLILTQYKETEAECFMCLNSLNSQMNCEFDNFEIIIINDCSDNILSEHFLKQFPNLDIQYVSMTKNIGKGSCLQFGIDHACGEYIMIVDIDDHLYSNYVFSYFESCIHPSKANLYITSFLESYKPIFSDEIHYMYHYSGASSYTHGKFYNRQFLIDNNIRFLSGIKWHDDVYINLIIHLILGETHESIVHSKEFVSYVWAYNDKSVTRFDDSFYHLYSSATFIYVVDQALSFSNDFLFDKLQFDAIKILSFYYYSVNTDVWHEERAIPWKEQTENMVSYFINKWTHLFEDMTMNKGFIEGHVDGISQIMIIPEESFPHWFNRIKALNITELPEFKQTPD